MMLTLFGGRHGRTFYCLIYPVNNLAYPTLARLRESAEKRVWQQRRGLVVIHCHQFVVRMRSREASAANRRQYRDATLNILCLI